ncbi:HEPN domain-containing protein [Chrysiogenes arsenatis]|uniref:HEPN domain-containing protein n=1 Tax=Chrysiogenes arsenatis TaxID=309797 RepID=UPI000429FD00|nr:HEPN domain-containing protein [Chrysiogenes arsenatis]
MKKEIAIEWMKASYADLLVISEIIDNNFLTHMVAFHSQQVIEKSLKAVLEYHNKQTPKKHDLLLLKSQVADFLQIENEDMLEDLNELYIESRYPGEMGLLPNGKPTPENAKNFYNFALMIFERVCAMLEIEKKELM